MYVKMTLSDAKSLTGVEAKVLLLLIGTGRTLCLRDIAAFTGTHKPCVSRSLRRLADIGLVRKVDRGWYRSTCRIGFPASRKAIKPLGKAYLLHESDIQHLANGSTC